MDKKCPNCGAEMQEEKFRLVCNYCDTVITLKNEENISQEVETESEKELSPARKLFDIKAKTFEPDAMETWETLCGFVNIGENTESYISALNKMAKNNGDIATSNVKQDVVRTAEANVTKIMVAGEQSLVFLNDGIFSKGKNGILITNRAIYFISKKNTYYLKLENFKVLWVSHNQWFLNADTNCKIHAWGVNNAQFAIILGLICDLAKNIHSENYKIGVGNACE